MISDHNEEGVVGLDVGWFGWFEAESIDGSDAIVSLVEVVSISLVCRFKKPLDFLDHGVPLKWRDQTRLKTPRI